MHKIIGKNNLTEMKRNVTCLLIKYEKTEEKFSTATAPYQQC